MSQCTFTDAQADGVTQAPITLIRLVHLMDLRSALNLSRSALGLPAVSYGESSPIIIKFAHVSEIRGGVQ